MFEQSPHHDIRFCGGLTFADARTVPAAEEASSSSLGGMPYGSIECMELQELRSIHCFERDSRQQSVRSISTRSIIISHSKDRRCFKAVVNIHFIPNNERRSALRHYWYIQSSIAPSTTPRSLFPSPLFPSLRTQHNTTQQKRNFAQEVSSFISSLHHTKKRKPLPAAATEAKKGRL